MKILVTGGAGFIASHIVDELIKVNYDVIVVDNFINGKKEFISSHARTQVFNIDILDYPAMNEVFVKTQPDIVIHHAAQIDVQASLKDPVFDAKTNILGTISLLELCRKYGVRKIIYASSAAVYGVPEYLGVDEEHPVEPLSFYGISKHTPEHYLKAYAQLYGINYTVLRYSNVYGPRQDPKGEGGVVSVFFNKLMNGCTPVIYGDGSQTRDFIYVKDIVSANIAALTKGDNCILNVSSNTQTTVKNLLETICDIMNKPFTANYAPARPGDILHSCLNNKKAIEKLDWKPTYSLLDGLKETYAYYVSQASRFKAAKP